MRRERFDRINIVPFVDIVLVLLVMVLATATFVQENRHRIDLPESNGTSAPSAPAIRIAVDANGSYFYRGKRIGWDALGRTIKAMDSNTSLLLRTDRRAPFGAFFRLIEAIKARQITQVSIATETTD